MTVPGYRRASERSEERPVPDLEARAAQAEARARRRTRTMCALALVILALVVLVWFVDLSAGYAMLVVGLAAVLAVVAEVVRHRPDTD